jgi:hypothetical protein
MTIERTEELRAESGSIDDTDPLVCFLYLLLRDHILPGDIENILAQARVVTHGEFTNGFLAQYAQNIAAKLRREERE